MIFIVNATAGTPLSFRTGRNNAETTTLPYIPGSALLGSLANAHTLLRDNADEFTHFFLKSTRFGNLYPASFDGEGKPDAVKRALSDPDHPVYPVPVTARSCKRFSGFRFDGEEEGDHHGVQDQLIAWALFALSGQTYLDDLDNDKLCKYLTCQESVDRVEGFYRRGYQPEQIGQPNSKSILRTRTGINRKTSTVEQSILYSRSALAEGSHFWGTIQIDDEAADEFEDFVEEANEAGLIRVGNNRTRGFGKLEPVEIDSLDQDSEVDFTAMSDRLKGFNRALQARIQATGMQTDYHFYTPITLTAEAILLDHLLRPQTSLTTTYLAKQCHLEDAALIYSNAPTRRVMGWNNLWRLPKADDIALGMGSVFLLGFRQQADKTLLESLFHLQRNGIGIRRNEGFGQLTIADPFHWEVNNL